jgi:hypothetical protein
VVGTKRCNGPLAEMRGRAPRACPRRSSGMSWSNDSVSKSRCNRTASTSRMSRLLLRRSDRAEDRVLSPSPSGAPRPTCCFFSREHPSQSARHSERPREHDLSLLHLGHVLVVVGCFPSHHRIAQYLNLPLRSVHLPHRWLHVRLSPCQWLVLTAENDRRRHRPSAIEDEHLARGLARSPSTWDRPGATVRWPCHTRPGHFGTGPG